MISQIDQDIAEKISAGKRFVIASHIRPDADAVGSLLGLGLALMKAGKTVQLVLEDGAEKYDYLPGSEYVIRSPVGEADMIIVVDCSDAERVGSVLNDYGQPDLVIDHHKTNLAFGKTMWWNRTR